jgi:hypothetical protein
LYGERRLQRLASFLRFNHVLGTKIRLGQIPLILGKSGWTGWVGRLWKSPTLFFFFLLSFFFADDHLSFFEIQSPSWVSGHDAYKASKGTAGMDCLGRAGRKLGAGVFVFWVWVWFLFGWVWIFVLLPFIHLTAERE